MRQKQGFFWVLALVVSFGFYILGGCGGGGSGSSSGTSSPASLSGIDLPTEISAIAANSDSSGSYLQSTLKSLSKAVADLPATSDYATVKTATFVDEPALQVFSIIQTIFKAVAQTHYADAGNVGTSADTATAYKAMVSWDEESEGRSQKEMEEWTLKSFMTTEDGQDVNVVHVWMEDDEEKNYVEFRIYTAPTQDETGTYTDYGVWKITANFTDLDDDPIGSFYADASVEAGETVLRLREAFDEEEDMGGQQVELNFEVAAIMHKTPTTGYGKAEVPKWDACWNPDLGEGDVNPCADGTIPVSRVKYAYNANYLGYQKINLEDDSTEAEVYKDRTDPVTLTYRYALFDTTAGANIEKSKNFGFPIYYTDSDDQKIHGYYGAWQGRHQLWAGSEGTVADDTTVTKETWGDEEPVSYTTITYPGTMTKRGLIDASLTQIKGIPVEIFLSDNFDLKYDATDARWEKCFYGKTDTLDQNGHQIWQETCVDEAFDLSALAVNEDQRKWVNIGAQSCDSYDPPTNCSYHQYTYNGTNLVENGTVYTPADEDRLWVSIGGNTYIVYSGIFTGDATGWVEKTLQSFDNRSWTPTFDDNADVAFDFPRDREYYINNKGINFVVRRIGAADAASSYEAKMEIQSVARPDNSDTVFPSGTSYFAMEWEDASSRSTFSFDADNMLLKFRTVGSNDSNASVGDTVTQGKWGLVAYNASDVRLVDAEGNPIQFNWEYTSDGNSWGKVTYLVKNDSTIQYLDDPIMLDPITLTTAGGDSLNFSLQYDGWMHGLPDMHWELQKNDFIITDDLRDKIVNIAAGTEVTQTGTSNTYYVKPLETGIILPVAADPGASSPDLTLADALSFDDIPALSTVSIGTIPTAEIKYVEGILVE
jgi:hypothetical protein